MGSNITTGSAGGRDINHPLSIGMLCWVVMVGYLFMLLMPGLLGAFVDQLGLTETQAGYVCAMNLFGMMLGALLSVVLVQKINVRTGLVWSACFMLVTEITSSFLPDYMPLMTIRFFNGISIGIVAGMAGPGIANVKKPDQAIAVASMLQYLMAAVGLTVLPYIFASTGMAGAYYLLAGFAVTLLLSIKLFPVPAVASGQPQTNKTGSSQSLLKKHIIIALVSLLIFYISNSSLWAYLDRIGVNAGIPVETVGFYLSVSMLSAMVTGILAAVFGTRFGRVLPLSLGYLGMIAGSYLLIGKFDAISFLVAVCLFNGAWILVLAYFVGYLAGLDSSGRLVALSNFAIAAGLAVGPGLGATLIGQGTYNTLLWIAIGGFVLSFTMILIALGMDSIESEDLIPTTE